MGVRTEHVVSPDVTDDVLADEAIRTVVGIAAIIIPMQLMAFAEGQIQFLTVEEKETDEATGKFQDERGLIQEKIRVADVATCIPEDSLTTVQRALHEEVLGDEGVRRIGHLFQRVVFERGRPEGHIPSIERDGGIEVVFYNGPVDDLLEHASRQSEVGNPKLDTVDSFFGHPNLRRTSVELLGFAERCGLLSSAVALFHAGKTEPVFPGQFQPDQLTQTRKKRPDLISCT